MTLDTKGPRLGSAPAGNTAGFVEPDFGPKITIKTEVATSPVIYAASFKYVTCI